VTPPADAVISTPARPVLAVEIEPRGARFYGWESIALEGATGSTMAALLLVIAYANPSDDASTSLGAVTGTLGLFYVGGLFVHGFHDKWRKALGSVGLTIGMPVTGVLTGFGIGKATCDTDACTGKAIAVGAAVGLFLAPFVDGLALGWDKRRNTYHGDDRALVVPSVVPVRGGASVGIAGSF
jgi:hypothetical protein